LKVIIFALARIPKPFPSPSAAPVHQRCADAKVGLLMGVVPRFAAPKQHVSISDGLNATLRGQKLHLLCEPIRIRPIIIIPVSDDIGIFSRLAHDVPKVSDAHGNERWESGIENVQAFVLVGLGIKALAGAYQEAGPVYGWADTNYSWAHECYCN